MLKTAIAFLVMGICTQLHVASCMDSSDLQLEKDNLLKTLQQDITDWESKLKKTFEDLVALNQGICNKYPYCFMLSQIPAKIVEEESEKIFIKYLDDYYKFCQTKNNALTHSMLFGDAISSITKVKNQLFHMYVGLDHVYSKAIESAYEKAVYWDTRREFDTLYGQSGHAEQIIPVSG